MTKRLSSKLYVEEKYKLWTRTERLKKAKNDYFKIFNANIDMTKLM